MSRAWEAESAAGAAGVLWIDHDVAADPDDLAAMRAAVAETPRQLLTGVLKLWPASTGRNDWIWSHRGGTLGAPVATQDETAPVAYIATGFLWTPRALLDLAAPAMAGWQWEQVDVRLSEMALSHAIPARAVPGCRPKHLHFWEAHDGFAW